MQDLQALLIGIDRYGPSRLVRDLHGAVADMDAVRELLLRCGVPRQSIRCLISSHDEARNRPEAAPTYEHMVAAIRELRGRAQRARGEALIYYSGHGGRADTLIPGAKGSDGKDEGLVPWNLHQSGAKLLHDVELTHLLTEMAVAKIPVTLVLDACHAGGVLRKSTRVARPKRIRGLFPETRGSGERVASVAELESTWQRVHYRSLRRLRHARRKSSGWTSRGLLQLPMVGVLAACRETEVAYEQDFGAGPRGVFTQNLLEALTRGSAPGSWNALQRWMARRMRRAPRTQWPVFEGNSSPTLFARLLGARDRPIEVLEFDPAAGRVLFDVGAAFGVCEGARLEVHTAGGRGPRVQARVEEAAAEEAWAMLEPSGDPEAKGAPGVRIEPGDEAMVVDPGSARLRVAVEREGESPRPERVLRNGRRIGNRLPRADSWIEQLRDEVRSRGEAWIQWVPGNDGGPPADLVVAQGGNGLTLLASGGEPLPGVSQVPGIGPRSVRRVVDRLFHLARFFRVRDLANRDERSALAGQVDAELGLLPRDWQPGSAIVAAENSVEQVRAGRWILLTVTSRAQRPLHLFVLDLRPDWSIELVHPVQGVTILEGNRILELPLEIYLPPGQPGGPETLKVLATASPRPPRSLCLPPLESPTVHRASGPRPPERHVWRNVSFRRAYDSWTTAEVELEVVPRPGWQEAR